VSTKSGRGHGILHLVTILEQALPRDVCLTERFAHSGIRQCLAFSAGGNRHRCMGKVSGSQADTVRSQQRNWVGQ